MKLASTVTSIAAATLLAACSSAPVGPVLAVSNGGRPRPASAGAAVALAMAGIGSEARADLEDGLAVFADRAIAKAHPLIVDLDEEPVDAALRRVLAARLPAITAAMNLAGSPWHADGISVELRDACPAAAVRCLPIFGAAPVDALEKRARILSWAFSSAALVRATSPIDDVVGALSTRAAEPDTTIALVLTSHPIDDVAVRAQAKRVGEIVDGSEGLEARWITALSEERAPALPLVLAEDEILIVPRLGVLARLSDFEREVDAQRGAFTWIFRPQSP
jgi:hypothetical protein